MFAIGLAFVLITVVGLVGNVLVLLVIALNKQMHESTSLFICNLALADLLFLAFCVPLTALSYLSNSWPFPDSLCYVTISLQYATCYVSVWTLVLLAHDRFTSITSPNAGRSLRRSRAVFWVCLAVWTVVLALNSLQMRSVGVLHFEYNGTSGTACVDSLDIALARASPVQARLFYWGFNLGAYLLPLTLSCAFYFLLVKELWRQKLVQTKSSQKMKRHATRMVFAVILTFGACWLPQNARFFLQGLNYPEASFWERDEKTLLMVQSIVQTLAYANSCVNPILYGLLSERFRSAFLRTISRLLCSLSPSRFSASPVNISTAPRTPPLAVQVLMTKRMSDANSLLEMQSTPQQNSGARLVKQPKDDGASSRSNSILSVTEQIGAREDSPRRGSVVLLFASLSNNGTATRLETLGEESVLGTGGESDGDEEEVVLL